MTAENVPKFQIANPKPRRIVWAKVSAPILDQIAASDSVARTASPTIEKPKMPKMVSVTLE